MDTRGDALATAHESWDQRWHDEQERSRWEHADPLVGRLVPLMRQRGFTRALDVGCGIGRHALYLAEAGFSCSALDASESALDHARARAAAAGVQVDYRRGTFYELPFQDGSIDAVIAWNVIYHGDRDIAEQALNEIRRVLVPNGLFVGTMLSTRAAYYGEGREIRPGTFVVDDANDDHVHPHFYCNTATLLELLRGFDIFLLQDREQTPGANHWEFLLERSAARQ